jgi:repressor LexA
VEKRDMAENGETVVALLDNKNVTLKRFYRKNDHIKLQPSNPDMKPIIIKKGDIKIQGVVIGLLRKFKR